MKTKKKRSSPTMEHFLYPNSSTDLRSDAHQNQIIGEGMQMKTILKLLGVYSEMIGEDISRGARRNFFRGGGGGKRRIHYLPDKIKPYNCNQDFAKRYEPKVNMTLLKKC